MTKTTLGIIVLGITAFTVLAGQVIGATNISSNANEHWAWSDVLGWINFYSAGTVSVDATHLTGYAETSIGDLSLDCATTRAGNICAQSTYGVTNDGAGNLSGWGWSDTYGWFSFDCANPGSNGCGIPYRTYITESGEFRNYAWNDITGWVSFNCADLSICATADYKVKTAWTPAAYTGSLDSATIDTGSASSTLLAILWHGNQPTETEVWFQIATSAGSGGPFVFVGPDGTTETWFAPPKDESAGMDGGIFGNARYVRYRMMLRSNTAQTLAPRVDDVVLSWSP